MMRPDWINQWRKWLAPALVCFGVVCFCFLGIAAFKGCSQSNSDQAQRPAEHPAESRAARTPELYPPVEFAKIADGQWKRPRASITGEVKAVRHEADGDTHIELTDGGKLVVLEIIPELKFAPPKVGDHIRAWGVVREDGWHGWWELHPLVGWEVAK